MIDAVCPLVSAALGDPVRELSPAPWGSKNSSWIARLGSGEAVVLQIFSHTTTAERRLSAVEQLARVVDLPLPRIRVRGMNDGRLWAVSALLPGEPGYVAAEWDLSAPSWPLMAEAMGRCVRTLQAVSTDDVDLPSVWRDPAVLTAEAGRWLEGLEPYLDRSTSDAVRREIAAAFRGGDDVVVCHGDFGPQNVLFLGEEVSGVLDFEDARVADPLLDVAWWNWLVRTHTPRAFERSWQEFTRAAGHPVDPGDEGTARRLRRLIVLRLLETAEHYRQIQPAKYPGWAVRIEKEMNVPLSDLVI